MSDNNNNDRTPWNPMPCVEGQELLLQNVANLMSQESKPVFETIQNMPPETIMPMLLNIVKCMPADEVREYLVKKLHLPPPEVEVVMANVYSLYHFLREQQQDQQGLPIPPSIPPPFL